jgi:hypothetical protein
MKICRFCNWLLKDTYWRGRPDYPEYVCVNGHEVDGPETPVCEDDFEPRAIESEESCHALDIFVRIQAETMSRVPEEEYDRAEQLGLTELEFVKQPFFVELRKQVDAEVRRKIDLEQQLVEAFRCVSFEEIDSADESGGEIAFLLKNGRWVFVSEGPEG